MPRRHRSTVCSICEPSLSLDQALVKDAVALLGRRSSGSGAKHIRIGIATPSPTAIASPLRSAGKKFISFKLKAKDGAAKAKPDDGML